MYEKNIENASVALQKVSPKNKISKDFKTCSKLISVFGSIYFCEQFMSMIKYCKSMCWNRISDADTRMQDTPRIASSMEPNTTIIMQQKNQFRKSDCKHVSKQKQQIAIPVCKHEWWCTCCFVAFLFFQYMK